MMTVALLVHAGAVIADMAVDLDGDRRVEARGDGVAPARVEHAPVAARWCPGRRRVQRLVELAQRGGVARSIVRSAIDRCRCSQK